MEPIVFEDGFLRVPKENPVLQEFLSLHPDNGKKFIEVNKEQDAQALIVGGSKRVRTTGSIS